jgi:branched-chain amino acid transport system substrate-binding protein
VRLRAVAAAVCVGALGLGVAACGGDGDSGEPTGSAAGAGTADIYSSLPLHGPSRDRSKAIVNGIRLALSQAGGKAGGVAVSYTSLDDSTARARKWDPGQTARNASMVADDHHAIGYIGDLDSGASAISLPILNDAQIPQVSPGSTYVGLTTDEPGSLVDEPGRYLPSDDRTFVRVVPRDTVQAAALLALMRQDGCTSLAIANDRETSGAGLARLLALTARRDGLRVVLNEGVDASAAAAASYAATAKARGADCFAFAGVTANGAVRITRDVAKAIPSAQLLGPDGICEAAFTNPSKGGIPASIARRFMCTIAGRDLRSYPAGRRFLAAYQQRFGGPAPDPYAVYGYESMKLLLDTIASLGDDEVDKPALLRALLATHDRDSVLGTYSFDQAGDTSLTDYGAYTVGDDGNPVFSSAVHLRR